MSNAQEFARDKSEEIETLLNGIEKTVRKALTEPQDLEEVVMQAIRDNPAYLETLERILTLYDHQVNRPERQ